jgi:hypothetical protein
VYMKTPAGDTGVFQVGWELAKGTLGSRVACSRSQRLLMICILTLGGDPAEHKRAAGRDRSG